MCVRVRARVCMCAYVRVCWLFFSFPADFSADYPPPIGTERAHKRSNSHGSPASFGQMPCELQHAHTCIDTHPHMRAHTQLISLPAFLPPSDRCILVWGTRPLVLQFHVLIRRPEGSIWVLLDRQCTDNDWTHTCYCQIR